MSGCKVQFGISNACGDNLFPGGADKDFWVGYVSDLGTRIPITQTGPVTSLHFTAYNGLVKFSSNKFAHVFSHDIVKGPGGNLSYLHRAVVKLLPLSTRDDVEVQRLTQAQDAFIVWQNNNDQFFIHGASKGLSVVAGALATTGQNTGDDPMTTITLEGAEKTLPLRFLVTDVAATINYLNSLVI